MQLALGCAARSSNGTLNGYARVGWRASPARFPPNHLIILQLHCGSLRLYEKVAFFHGFEAASQVWSRANDSTLGSLPKTSSPRPEPKPEGGAIRVGIDRID